jgi:hypothetical protein
LSGWHQSEEFDKGQIQRSRNFLYESYAQQWQEVDWYPDWAFLVL